MLNTQVQTIYFHNVYSIMLYAVNGEVFQVC